MKLPGRAQACADATARSAPPATPLRATVGDALPCACGVAFSTTPARRTSAQDLPRARARGRIVRALRAAYDGALAEVEIPAADLEVSTMRSGGAGGQNVNKVESAVRMVHVPSGLTVRCGSRETEAKRALRAALAHAYRA